MQQALLCTTAPVKAVFGGRQPHRYRRCAVAFRPAAVSAARRSRGDNSACMVNMPHANSGTRRDTTARAEERDSLLVSNIHYPHVLIGTQPSRDHSCPAQAAAFLECCPANHLLFAGSSASKLVITRRARGGLAHDLPSFCISCCWWFAFWI